MSALKGFLSSFKILRDKFGGVLHETQEGYQTLNRFDPDKYGADVAPMFLNDTGITGTLDAAPASHTQVILIITAHGRSVGDIINITSGALTGRSAQIDKVINVNTLLLGTKLPSAPVGSETFSVSRFVRPAVNSSGAILTSDSQLTLIDSTDDLGNGSGPGVIDTQNDQIPAQTAPPLLIVAALASDVKRVFVTGDIGEFVEIYSDALGANKLASLNLTPDFSRNVFIPAGTAIYISNVKDAPIGLDPAGANSLVLIDFMG